MIKNFFNNIGKRLTDYLIWDDPYESSDGTPSFNSKRKKMNELCNNCEHCKKVLAPSNPPTYNIKCTHPETNLPGGGKILKFKADYNEIVSKPYWCPLFFKGNNDVKTETTVTSGNKKPKHRNGTDFPSAWEMQEALKDIKPRIAFSDVKVGDIIHIPPTPPDFKRMDIRIHTKYAYSMTGTAIGVTPAKEVYLYNSGLNSFIISKKEK